MFTEPTVIATSYTAIILTAGACAGFALGHLAAQPAINRLRAKLADAVWQLAHDPLTGIYNRHGLRAIHTAIASSGIPQPIIAVLIDLDGFKEINDEFGHGTGDNLLTRLAERLESLIASHCGSVARHSGDEYAAILPVRGHSVTEVAEQIMAAITEPIEVQTEDGPKNLTVTASIGIAVVASTDPLQEVALDRADIAMYHAKHHGGNRYVLYTAGMTMPLRAHRRGPRLRDLRHDRSGGTA